MLKIVRTQLPTAPAFAMTAHAAQGQTLRNGATRNGHESYCKLRGACSCSIARATTHLPPFRYRRLQSGACAWPDPIAEDAARRNR
eukprot:12467573-Alexandrium_andersonii.AAC.1